MSSQTITKRKNVFGSRHKYHINLVVSGHFNKKNLKITNGQSNNKMAK